MKVIIIDDEKQAIASLEMELLEIEPKIEIIGTANSVSTGSKMLNELTPDILFLDIRLGDGLGFDVLENLNNLGDFAIIFTTAYDQYAIESFKHGAIDYLLKPVDHEDLQAAINRIASSHLSKKKLEEIEKIAGIATEASKDARLALNTTEGIYLKKVQDIIHIQADGNYTKFFFRDQTRPQLISRTLKDYERMLEKFGFVRIHFSHLINIRHLDKYLPKDGGCAVMSNKDVLPVSTRKKSNLMDVLKDFSQNPI